MGEGLLSFYKHNVKKEWKIAFFAAFIACLLIHIYKFTNTLPNHDSLYNVYSNQDMTMSGRWLLSLACGISSYFDLPWINGLLCAVYLGITAAIVAELFGIKNPVVIVLSAIVLAATPSTTETLFFEYTADGYLMGLALSALTACLSCKGTQRQHLVFAGLCLCLSCGIYQAYISFAVVLCICYLLLKLLDGSISVHDSWKWIGKHVLVYGVALAAYYGIWKLILFATGRTATDYQGISEVGKIGISTILSGAFQSVKNILFFYLEWNVLKHPITLYGALNIVFVVALIAILMTALIKSGVYKDLPRLCMILFCLIASIPMISVWCFLSENIQYRPMMLHSISLYYILALILFDKWVATRISTLFGLFMVIVLFNFSVMANISYFYLDKCYEKSYYVGSQMMERIEELSDTAAPDTIAFIGSRAQDVVISTQFPGSRVHMLTELIEEDFLFNGEHAYLYLKNTFGMDIPIATSSQQAELIQNPDVVKMSAWPAADSVAVVDGVLVIKLQENP